MTDVDFTGIETQIGDVFHRENVQFDVPLVAAFGHPVLFITTDSTRRHWVCEDSEPVAHEET